MNYLRLLISLLYFSSSYGQIQLGDTLYGNQDQQGFTFGEFSMARSVLRIATSEPLESTPLKNTCGAVRTYEWDGETWVQYGQTIFGEESGDRIEANCLSSDGSFIAIGSSDNYGGNSIQDAGHVRVFKFNGSDWQQLGSDIDGNYISGYFGRQVELSSNGMRFISAAIGSDINGTNCGEVYVYEYSNNNWIQVGNSLFGNIEYGLFGNDFDMSDDGTNIIISATSVNINGVITNGVMNFELQNNQWITRGDTIFGVYGAENGVGKVSISPSGNRIAVVYANNTFVKIFEIVENVWTQVGQSIFVSGIGQGNCDIEFNCDASKLLISNGNYPNSFHQGIVEIYSLENNVWVSEFEPIIGVEENDYMGTSAGFSEDGKYFGFMSTPPSFANSEPNVQCYQVDSLFNPNFVSINFDTTLLTTVDTILPNSNIVVMHFDSTLAIQEEIWQVSSSGDSLSNGLSVVIIPGISDFADINNISNQISLDSTLIKKVKVKGALKFEKIDTLTDNLAQSIVRSGDQSLNVRASDLHVSINGDTLFLGYSWIVVPGISNANIKSDSTIENNKFNNSISSSSGIRINENADKIIIDGKLYVGVMKLTQNSEFSVVRDFSGKLFLKSLKLQVSETGDILSYGNSSVIIPGISNANN